MSDEIENSFERGKADDGRRKLAPDLRLTAMPVPYSSIVGVSISLKDATGKVVGILMVSVPNPCMPYMETAAAIADIVCISINRARE